MKLANFILLTVMMLSVACSSIFDNDIEELPFEGKIFLEIAGPYIREQVPTHNSTIRLKTEQIYGCNAYEIEYAAITINNKIFVELSNRFIVPRTSCNDAQGPANARIPVILSMGSYKIYLKIGSYTDHYNLIFDEDGYSLLAVNTSFSAPLESELP